MSSIANRKLQLNCNQKRQTS